MIRKLTNKKLFYWCAVAGIICFILLSYSADVAIGKNMASTLWNFIFSMIKIFPSIPIPGRII